MAKTMFKAESKRLLDLMINSIYTHKEIFLRELISNASDASDKLYYKALTENLQGISREDLSINVFINKENRTLMIEDHGIGMNKEDLENHLGTIAESGSLAFKKALDKDQEDIDIIGQFGVGFYSAFMVAKKIEVVSRKYGEDQGYVWVSEGEDGYEIFESNAPHTGTIIKLHLKDNTEDDNYDEYLEEYHIQDLVKKYSDYVHYPIKMNITTTRKIEGSDDYEDIVENKVINSMVPLWKRNKKDITKEEYHEFYKDKFNDYKDPLNVIHYNVEGNVSFTSLLFIPSSTPFNYYSKDYEKGLQLYSRGVFIMDKASDLVPEHFRFVKGLVDSQDLSLNISREILQHDKQLKLIANRIEKKIKSELEFMLKNDRENYELFWNNFGLQLKFGIYQSYGMEKENLQDLLLFYSSKKQGLTTLKEYVDNMKENQKEIYFVSGQSYEKIDRMPIVETVKDKDYEILYLKDEVDEFMLQMMRDYQEKAFKNISQGDLDLDTQEEKEALEKKKEEHKDLLEALKEALSDKVVDVRLSNRLKNHPVCLVSSDGVSFEMEKVLNNLPTSEERPEVKAGRILEMNSDHPLIEALTKIYETNPEDINDYGDLLYNQALLIEGFSIDDPIEFSNKICELMVKASR